MTSEQLHDVDPLETKEWLEALSVVKENNGNHRVQYLLQALFHQAIDDGIDLRPFANTPYRNSLRSDSETVLDEKDKVLLEKVSVLIRWNAIAMVLRAGKKNPDLGGHIATYASAAYLYDLGFAYFFKGFDHPDGSDLIYYQGHASPGIYARAFLEGRLTAEQLNNFRQEVGGNGLSSYPHPWLMGDFWQFPTVSMGLGPLQAIYQARFLKYLQNRSLLNSQNRKVWAFLGDGEVDEPESLGALSIAARENLDNLIFVVNCNLQRLDGPVRGNGKIIQELERIFNGAGWKVIKVIWGSAWDDLFAKDTTGLLQRTMNAMTDGAFQSIKPNDGAALRKYFFEKDPALAKIFESFSDEDLASLNRGGHDLQKVFEAYSFATRHRGQPTVILVKTIKGYGMGDAGEGMNSTHQQKKMTIDQLKIFRDRFAVPISDEKIDEIPFYRPAEDSEEIQFIQEKRRLLGGYLPLRMETQSLLDIPQMSFFASVTSGLGDKEISTTMVFVRILSLLLKEKSLSSRIVPIVPDECRTFGMEGMFRQIGIYAPSGQLYEPIDRNQVMYYREAKDGQILEEGINEAGAFCSWIAASTSYSTNQLTMIPFYIYYSMFGFQRIGDLAWAAGDMKAKGFLLGGTAGRTSLAGEGLQHQDGHSHLQASMIPNCRAYDPCFSYELAVVIQHGLECMYVKQEAVFFYLTVMNENYKHPDMPIDAGPGIIKGMYLFQEAEKPSPRHVQLLGSGTILREVIKAAVLLEADFGITSDIWSVTSFNELRRDGLSIERHNRMHPESKQESFVSSQLSGRKGPVIASTDYMRLYADQIRAFIKAHYIVLGTDGFGRSDGREQLRHFFEVSAIYIVFAALSALVDLGEAPQSVLFDAIKRYDMDMNKLDPITN